MKPRLKQLIANARSWWEAKRAYPHISGWDNPANGHDLLAAMLETEHARKRRLP